MSNLVTYRELCDVNNELKCSESRFKPAVKSELVEGNINLKIYTCTKNRRLWCQKENCFWVRFFGRIRKRICDPRSYGFFDTKKTQNPKKGYFVLTRQAGGTQHLCQNNPCTFGPIDFWFQIENTKSEFLCFSIFKYKLKIEIHPFFSGLQFFSFLFVAENVILNINFFWENFNFQISFFPFLFYRFKIEKMKIFKPFILI